MTEYSYPIENEPMPGSNWSSVTKGIGNGILDEGGFPYNLINLNNATNKATVTAANLGDGVLRSHAILDGFYHRIDANVVIDLPAVTKATTYYVALQYVPTRSTEGKLPVQLGVFTSLDRTQSKDYLVLWTVLRQANQLLTDATVTMGRQRVAGTVIVASESDLPAPSAVLWGTLGVVHNGRDSDRAKILMAITDTSETGGWKWKTLSDRAEPAWVALPDTGNAVWAGEGLRKEIQRSGTSRKIHGTVKKSDGSAYTENSTLGYKIATLSGVDLPAGHQRFPVVFTGADKADKSGFIEISRTNQEARLYLSSGSAAYCYIPTIEYQAEQSA